MKVSLRKPYVCWHGAVVDKQADTLRVFFALWPDSMLQTALHKLGSDLNAGCGGRAQRLETIHLTLAFIGALPADRLEALYAAAARVSVPAFGWQIDQLGYWRRNQLLWAGTSQPPEAFTTLVGQLHAALNDAGLAFDASKPFVPHITLLRKARCEHLVQPPQALYWQVREFVLVQSETAAESAGYRVMRRWPLA